MKKRFLSVVMASAMVAACLTGCGGSSEDTTAADTTADAESGDDASSGDAETVDVDVAQASDDAVQNLINATTDTVTLTVWASEEDQDFTQGRIDSFVAQYPEVTFDISLGAESESTAKDTVLTDIEAAADVYAFAGDQLSALVNAGALQEVSATYTYDVANENAAASVNAASVDGKLYAYPMTADNGYFLLYDSNVYSESDVDSLDKMLEVAAADGSKVGMILGEGWYSYGFFAGAGYQIYKQDDGSNYCDWNSDGGTDVVQAILDIATNESFDCANGTEALQTGIQEGTYSAIISGVWDAEACQAVWGDGFAGAKLPTFTVAGEQKQMGSFLGYKMIGVNPYSDYVGWSMLLAEYLTNEESQVARFEARGNGPTNIVAASADEVQASPAVAGQAAQAEYASSEGILGDNYWSPANTFFAILASGNPDGTDLQELLDNAVEGMTAPIE